MASKISYSQAVTLLKNFNNNARSVIANQGYVYFDFASIISAIKAENLSDLEGKGINIYPVYHDSNVNYIIELATPTGVVIDPSGTPNDDTYLFDYGGVYSNASPVNSFSGSRIIGHRNDV